METLTITREGEFTVEKADDDEQQCGMQGSRTFFYRVKITCFPSALDDRGFIVDQFDIDRWMQDQHRTLPSFPSCERIALGVVQGMAKLCPEAVRISAWIGASPVAAMRADWRKESRFGRIRPVLGIEQEVGT